MNSTEVSHSQHVISELLELIIDSDELGLTVSEVEGDAVMFYKTGEPPRSWTRSRATTSWNRKGRARVSASKLTTGRGLSLAAWPHPSSAGATAR